MTIHNLKIYPQYFEAVRAGNKTFEVREKRDRRFNTGDIVNLQWHNPETGEDGEVITREISYTLDTPEFCKAGFIIFGLRPVGDTVREAAEELLNCFDDAAYGSVRAAIENLRAALGERE